LIALFLKRETVGKGGRGASAAQNIAKPQPPQAKDAFIATIMAIKAVTLPVMNAGSGQMTHPPDGQKEG